MAKPRGEHDMSTPSNDAPREGQAEGPLLDRISTLSDMVDKMAGELEKRKRPDTVAIIASITAALAVAVSGINVYLSHQVENTKLQGGPLVLLLSKNSAGNLKQGGDARPGELKQAEAWVRIHLKDGSSYEGWPEFYSVFNVPSEVYLSPACTITNMGSSTQTERIPGPGVIVVQAEIRVIELIDRTASPCFNKYLGVRAKP